MWICSGSWSWCRSPTPCWPSRPLAWWAGHFPPHRSRACPTSARLLGRAPVTARGRAATCARGPGLGYWSTVSRSLRHPFGGSHHYLRPEKDRQSPAQRRQAAEDAPEPVLDGVGPRRPRLQRGPSRPAAPHRRAGRRSACSPCSACGCGPSPCSRRPAAAQAVNANQIRAVPVEPTRGLILDRNGNPLVGNQVVEQITLSRVSAAQHPQVIGRLAALLGETTAQVQASIADPRYSLYKPVPIYTGGTTPARSNRAGRHPLHQGAPGRLPRRHLGGQTTQRSYPQGELPGPAQGATRRPRPSATSGPSTPPSSRPRASQGYQAGDAVRAVRPRVPVRAAAAGDPRSQADSRSTPRARWPARSRPRRPPPATTSSPTSTPTSSRWPTTPWPPRSRTSAGPTTSSATTTPGATRRPPAGRWW